MEEVVSPEPFGEKCAIEQVLQCLLAKLKQHNYCRSLHGLYNQHSWSVHCLLDKHFRLIVREYIHVRTKKMWEGKIFDIVVSTL